MPSSHLKMSHFNEDLFVYNQIFKVEYNCIKPVISHVNISEMEVYSTCLGISRYYLKDIGSPPDYPSFYQAVFDIYIGQLTDHNEMISCATQYLDSLKD
jgi:hypothetical protein